MKISFYTFGCTVNNYETQKMRDLFLLNGDTIIEDGTADAFIINSCAITSSVEKGAVQLITRLKKRSPHSVVVIVGCYGESLKKSGKSVIPGADIVIDNNKFNIVEKVHEFCDLKKEAFLKSTPTSNFSSTAKSPRALLQIQNGCNNGCTFCIVPHVRGRSVSKPFGEFKEELKLMVSQGYKEIVLAGLNLGFYHDGDYTLSDILKEANSVEGLESIRLSSLEPMNLDDRFVDELPNFTKLSPHLHISLQSGCDRILHLMNRKYSFEEYFQMITKIREKVPTISITTDIIVGFPDESDSDFDESIKNIIRCNFSDIHIFKYSKRAETPAARMKNQITEHQKIKRSLLLKGVKLQSRYNYTSKFVGKIEEIILLKKIADNSFEGVTAHNIKVLLKSSTPLKLGIIKAKITGISNEHEFLYAEI